MLAEYGSAFVESQDAQIAEQKLMSIWQNVLVMTPSTRTAMTLFGIGTGDALAKLLLGDVDPIPMASFLYLDSGVTALFLLLITNLSRKGQSVEVHLTCADMPWMAGAMFSGCVAAPIVLLLSLQNT